MTNRNDLFGRFDDVLKSVAGAPDGVLGSFWGRRKKLTYADMFCGIGGFHAAADKMDLKCVFACDIDDDCRTVYQHNYNIKPKSDICQLTPEEIPDHDILFAGFPCQPFSIIGNGGGFSDARGTLFFELARIIEAKKPQALLLENVKQLVSHNGGKTMTRILEILRELGYQVDYRVLNALNFGLPHKRERVFIVGLMGDSPIFRWPDRVLPMVPLREILEKEPETRHYVSERIKRKRMEQHTPKITPSIWHENKAGNISSHPFSCALRAGASYNYLLVDGERRLTPREMLRLQGFPDTFEIVGSDSAIRKQAGNSVPVPMVKAVLERILHAQKSETKGEISEAC